MIRDKFDLDKFYKYGFTTTKVDVEYCDLLLKLIRQELFQQESGRYGSDNLSFRVFPEYEAHPRVATAFQTDLIESFWETLAEQDYFSYFRSSFGKFTKIFPLALKYRERDGMAWHFDVFDASHLLNILYVTDEQFMERDGGALEIAKVMVDKDGCPFPDSVIKVGVVTPNHGTLVTIDNMNPTLLHSVTKLGCTKERIALSCQYGYLENKAKEDRNII